VTALIGSILKLIVLIFGQWLEKKKKDRAYRLDVFEFEKIAQEAIAKMRTQAQQDSQQAGSMDDSMDEYIRNSNVNSKEE
jgi:hypothetical protein